MLETKFLNRYSQWVESLIEFLNHFDSDQHPIFSVQYVEKFPKYSVPISFARYALNILLSKSADIEGWLANLKHFYWPAIQGIFEDLEAGIAESNSQVNLLIPNYVIFSLPSTTSLTQVWLNLLLVKEIQVRLLSADWISVADTNFSDWTEELLSGFKKIESHSAKNNETIDNRLHFVWIGKPIPLKYLTHIFEFFIRAYPVGIDTYLWVDKEISFYKAIDANVKAFIYDDKQGFLPAKNSVHNYFSDAKSLMKRIHLKKIDDLNRETKAYYQQKNQWRSVNEVCRREIIGLGNYAAEVDLERLKILHQYGGIYMDCDNKPAIQGLSTEDRVLNSEKSWLRLPELAQSFAMGVVSADHQIAMNNNLIFSCKKHPLLEAMIDGLLQAYSLLDKKIADRKTIGGISFFRSYMDLKRSFEEGLPLHGARWQSPDTVPETISYRLELTCETSGPVLGKNMMKKFAAKHGTPFNLFCLPKDYVDSQFELRMDGNWLKPFPHKSVDDLELAKVTGMKCYP